MTWGARFTDKDGNVPGDGYNACIVCKHMDICNLRKMQDSVQTMLTAADTHCGDGSQWANGEAVLKCNGFESFAGSETASTDKPDKPDKPE